MATREPDENVLCDGFLAFVKLGDRRQTQGEVCLCPAAFAVRLFEPMTFPEVKIIRVSRRSILTGVIGGGIAGRTIMPGGREPSRATASATALKDLDSAAASPVLKLDGLKSPVIIESIKLLKMDKEYFVHVRAQSRPLSRVGERSQLAPASEGPLISLIGGEASGVWTS